MSERISRRELLRRAAGTGGALLLQGLTGCESSSSPAAPALPWPRRSDFAADGEGWGDGWISAGVANLRCENGFGVLEAGSDIFPNDPRPVVFARDSRVLDTVVEATIVDAGSAVGLVVRRQSQRIYYAAVYETDSARLALMRRDGFDWTTLASAAAFPGTGAMLLELRATGTSPTTLVARLNGASEISATDDLLALQQPGEAGVLAQADTLLPDSNPVLPALGNLHLLPYSVQEGQVVIATPVGQQFIEAIRRRSTARFSQIVIDSPSAPSSSIPRVIAATTGAPFVGGATVHVACDLPAEVAIEVANDPGFAGSTTGPFASTGAFDAITIDIAGPTGAERAYWRPRVRRGALESIGPARSFRRLPPPGDPAPLSLVYGSCAAQFRGIFDLIAARQPDVFLWQGDLNYADTHGPFAQGNEGYAGIWRHFLDNPRLEPILSRAHFVAGRDDHDYGLQDAWSETLVPWGLAPWDALMNPRPWQRLSIGLLDVFVLDQRLHKTDPALPDTIDKTLLGLQQRQWLLEGLASSAAPFKILCSPCTLAPAPGANARDGSWAAGFTAERDLLLQHIREHVSGHTIFLTGDTHFTMLWDRDGLFEQRACPLDIPLPNDQNISNPALELTFGSVEGVAYWSRMGHFTEVRVGVEGSEAVMDVDLVREDGVVVSSRRFAAVLGR